MTVVNGARVRAGCGGSELDPDVLVLGAGQNGLTAAAVLAGAGLQVMVIEAAEVVGGAVRTEEATLPGYRHDTFSGFYPLARVGPIARLPLDRYGLRWCSFDRPYGGGTPDGVGFVVEQTEPETRTAIRQRTPGDVQGWDELWTIWQRVGHPFLDMLFHPLGDLPPALKLGLRLASPQALLSFAQLSVTPARTLANQRFASDDARVWFIGSARHSDLLPEAAGSSMYALVLLGLGQEVGMPVPAGGAQAIPNALRACVEDRGGVVQTGERVEAILVRGGRAIGVRTRAGEILARRGVLATIEPQQVFLQLLPEGVTPGGFLQAIRRIEWGTAVMRLELALSGLPTFRADTLNGVGVLHLGASSEALSASAGEATRGLLPAEPFLIFGMASLADPTRAPAGGHTVYLETHVPARIRGDAAGSIQATDWPAAKEPMVERMLDQLERYAPGVRSLIRGWAARTPPELEAANANLVAGDIAGGSYALHQQLVFRPVPGWFRHRTPVKGLYLGGASTHPGAGVHGAAGSNAARILLGDLGLARRWKNAFDPT
jgi:phytoene dehydrogenase-like protein